MKETDIAAALSLLRPQMLRFARLQLRSDDAAEDAVQEALLAAMEGAAGFAGAAALKTWVFSILRNKIIDDIRRRAREPERQRRCHGLPDVPLPLQFELAATAAAPSG